MRLGNYSARRKKTFAIPCYNAMMTQPCSSLHEEQEVVLLTLLGKDVLAVEQQVGAGGHVRVSELLLVDAHAIVKLS